LIKAFYRITVYEIKGCVAARTGPNMRHLSCKAQAIERRPLVGNYLSIPICNLNKIHQRTGSQKDWALPA